MSFTFLDADREQRMTSLDRVEGAPPIFNGRFAMDLGGQREMLRMMLRAKPQDLFQAPEGTQNI